MIAIIKLSDNSITIDQRSAGDWRLEIPGTKVTVSPVQIGWEGGGYRIADVARFIAPEGKVQTGEPSYEIDGDDVVETNGIIDKPAPQPPEDISDRQFAHALFKNKVITFEAALAFVATGTIPAELQNLIDAIPTETDRQDAELLITGSTIFHRHHPFTEMLAQANGWTPAQTDDFWRFAASL